MPHTAHRETSGPFLLCLATLLVTVIVVALGSSLVAGCNDGIRHVKLDERTGTGISLSQLWRDIAEAAECDPNTMSLESMRLEYSETGPLAYEP